MKKSIEIIDLTVRYAERSPLRTAVDHLNISIDKGNIYGFLGPNGAGKTTTIKCILGILHPSKGQILINGKPASKGSRASIGYMPEIANYYWYLKPRELLSFYGRLFGMKSKTVSERSEKLLDLVGLSKNKNSLLGTFSKGMLQKVSFAQALINDPDILILDEPTTGLDPIAKMEIRDYILDFKAQGKTVFFSSHELSEAELISDKVSIVKSGKVLKEITPGNIMDEKGVQLSLEKYFFDLVKDR